MCPLFCTNCTLSQLANTTFEWKPTNQNRELLVAVAGRIDAIVIQAINDANNASFQLGVILDKRSNRTFPKHKLQVQRSEGMPVTFALVPGPQAPSLAFVSMDNAAGKPFHQKGYNLHVHLLASHSNAFYAVKYTDNRITTTTEYQEKMNLAEKIDYDFGFESVFNDSYPFPNCPHHIHYPKMFSWRMAKSFCHRFNASLPELISRNDQEDLVSTLYFLKKDNPLFLIEALFIQLHKSTEVKPIFVSQKDTPLFKFHTNSSTELAVL